MALLKCSRNWIVRVSLFAACMLVLISMTTRVPAGVEQASPAGRSPALHSVDSPSFRRQTTLRDVVQAHTPTGRVRATQYWRMHTCLDQYRTMLRDGTMEGLFEIQPNSIGFTSRLPREQLPIDRSVTMDLAFSHVIAHGGRVVVEVGTTHSFRGCDANGCDDTVNNPDPKLWDPDRPDLWDRGAGSFTRIAPLCMKHIPDFTFTTVDLVCKHIDMAKVILRDLSSVARTVCASSVDYFASYSGPPIDLIYLDTGDMVPVGPSAALHLEEAKTLTKRRAEILSANAIVLIDDVRNQAPFQAGTMREFGAPKNEYGKSVDSIPYFLEHGWTLLASGYQFILQAPPLD